MSSLTDKEILDFVREKLTLDKDEKGSYTLKEIRCLVYGDILNDIHGDIFGDVVGDVVGDVLGDVGGGVLGRVLGDVG